ncbi:PIN domain-containing protein [Trueperella pecoris]|uniref:PIN domain-containing protein n=1 Tax=Trueperella pecoris TaxID=2733571 RepID=UPI001ABE20AD|nr:PIN domain-containing protein [Trueperella pecoris]QTG75175.1 PIN domain-containing protein [Trueperella pecoris]
MTYLLDTNMWIEILRGNARVVDRFGALATEQIVLSPIVLGELHVGALKSRRSKEALAQVTAIANTFTHTMINADTAVHYAKIRGALEAAGTPIGANDLWIAADALTHRCTLVTHNTREFERIPALKLKDWLAY